MQVQSQESHADICLWHTWRHLLLYILQRWAAKGPLEGRLPVKECYGHWITMCLGLAKCASRDLFSESSAWDKRAALSIFKHACSPSFTLVTPCQLGHPFLIWGMGTFCGIPAVSLGGFLVCVHVQLAMLVEEVNMIETLRRILCDQLQNICTESSALHSGCIMRPGSACVREPLPTGHMVTDAKTPLADLYLGIDS